MRKMSVRMHAHFLMIHRAAYLVRRRAGADGSTMVALSAPVMHPIVHMHMHSALQSLGITDHPHGANAVSLHYPRWY